MKGKPQTSATIGVLLLLFWVLVGTIGFALIENWPLTDALYMTIITISTVGYGEVHTLSPWGRLFTSFIIVAGLGTAAYTFTRLGQVVLEGELRDILGRRRMKSELEKLSGHYIVCGFGRIGKLVAEGLEREGVPFCVIESEASLEKELQAGGHIYLIGDATEESNLKAAGIEKAKALLALLGTDADNLYLIMTAKGIHPGITVIARALDEKAEVKLKRGGADKIVSPSKIASLRVLQAAVRPTVVELMELVTPRQSLSLRIEEVKVAEASSLNGLSIAEAGVRRRFGVMIMAIKRVTGEMLFNPDPSEPIRAGEILVVIGKDTDLKKLGEACQAGPAVVQSPTSAPS